MTNPIFKYFLIAFDPEEDADRLNQNLQALVDFAQYELVHIHHMWVGEFAVNALAAGASQDITVTFPTGQFGPNATPKIVSAQLFSAQTALTDNSEWGTTSVFNESSAGASVRVRNQSASAFGAGTVFLRVKALDLTYDTSS